ncbi:MAG: hypothetical protein ACM3X9_00065 [Bacillota bacterium]
MDNQNQPKNMGEVSRTLMEKAKKGFEFGKMGQPDSRDVVQVGQPKSNHTGIDRGRWAD